MEDLKRCTSTCLGRDGSGVYPWILEKSVIILNRWTFMDRLASCVIEKSVSRLVLLLLNQSISLNQGRFKLKENQTEPKLRAHKWRCHQTDLN